MKYLCISNDSTRIGITNIYQLKSYTVEAESEEEAFKKATALIQVGCKIFVVMVDKYGPDWKLESE